MASKLPNYLRTFRKRAYFTQDEMAFLLGTDSGTRVSRYERFTREPAFETALAYSVIFTAPPEELFSGVHGRVAERVRDRASRLLAKLDARPQDAASQRKRDALRAITMSAP